MIDYGWRITDTPNRKPVIIYLPLLSSFAIFLCYLPLRGDATNTA
jgi:hypothetical protein